MPFDPLPLLAAWACLATAGLLALLARHAGARRRLAAERDRLRLTRAADAAHAAGLVAEVLALRGRVAELEGEAGYACARAWKRRYQDVRVRLMLRDGEVLRLRRVIAGGKAGDGDGCEGR